MLNLYGPFSYELQGVNNESPQKENSFMDSSSIMLSIKQSYAICIKLVLKSNWLFFPNLILFLDVISRISQLQNKKNRHSRKYLYRHSVCNDWLLNVSDSIEISLILYTSLYVNFLIYFRMMKFEVSYSLQYKLYIWVV